MCVCECASVSLSVCLSFASLVQEMFTALTTANFPDVFLPAYRHLSKATAIYFVVFMVSVFYLVCRLSGIFFSLLYFDIP